jgi:hypothetical protein
MRKYFLLMILPPPYGTNRDLHRKLRDKGFQLPPGESDFIERLTVRRGKLSLSFLSSPVSNCTAGGYYIDQGCSGLIVNGSASPHQPLTAFILI